MNPLQITYEELLDASDVAEALPGIVGKYRRTSDPTIKYNCLAWAVQIQWAWFDPTEHCAGYHWPEGIPREWTTSAIRKLLARFGYEEETDRGDLEEGYLKVAFFEDESGPTHFARQLDNGKWTSKLGNLIDVEHDTLDCLEGADSVYGEVKFFLKRKV